LEHFMVLLRMPTPKRPKIVLIVFQHLNDTVVRGCQGFRVLCGDFNQTTRRLP
jgi:hypothetical protein